MSSRTGKRVTNTYPVSERDNILNCDHIAVLEDFSITDRESNHYPLETKENILTKQEKLCLNRNKYSQELFLF